jgi:thioredoxin-like negative regulator of GroEL
MLTPSDFRAAFAQALPYDAYLKTAEPHELSNWRVATDRIKLSDAQAAVVRGFSRQMNILVVSGTWCGDCVQQCPILAKIAAENTQSIDLRFLDRDEHIKFARHFQICGGDRVPTVIFLNEEHEFMGLYGDKTLSRLRASAARQFGAACALPGAPVPHDEKAELIQDWLNEVERIALLLRLSPKLRAKHGDCFPPPR